MEYYQLKGESVELKDAPEVIKLLPLGHVRSEKGDFEVDQESFDLMRRRFLERGLDLVIDYEHQTLKDVQAPAAGWVKDLILQEDAIAAKVEWTPRAKEYLKNREYRYLSPVVLVRRSDNKAVVMHSGALTNTPAIDHMFAVVNKGSDGEKEGGTGMETLLKKLAALLGLPEEASEEDVLKAFEDRIGGGNGEGNTPDQKKKEGSGVETEDRAAGTNLEEEKVVANKIICSLLGLKAGAPTSEAAAAIMALKSGIDSTAAGRLRELEEKLAKRDADDAVEMALKSGKIAPAQKEWASAYALKDPSGFKDFVEKAPQVVPMEEIQFATDAAVLKGAHPEGLDRAAKAVFAQLGISDDDYKTYGR